MDWLDLDRMDLPGALTRPSRFPPFGFSLARGGGGLLHRAREVVFEWERGQVVNVGAIWACGSGLARSTTARLVQDSGDFAWCRLCDIPNEQGAPSVVYVGTTSNGFVKVGCTTALARRRLQLDIVLLGFCPGAYEVERALLEAMGKPVIGREWFAPGNETKALVWLANRPGGVVDLAGWHLAAPIPTRRDSNRRRSRPSTSPFVRKVAV